MIVATAGQTRIEVLHADLLDQEVDALVTAANRTLSGGNQAGFGGGVDGAVHRAAGPELLAAILALGGCPAGDAVATGPGRLAVKWVIHAVGPVWGCHGGEEDRLLASAHRRSLELATELGCASLAFPAISCGVYKFPLERAARVALGALVRYLQEEAHALERIRYCLFSEEDYSVFAGAFWELAESESDLVLSES